ncbi:CoA ester lyase [Parasphingorhabdus sp.]|uniref:HpcH/HpaI aldolase/citrate lyase family protein n=1 Tax=Parasphingorhabdus sp. TaxID=2709688 RepID=UPI0032EC065C
MNLRSLLFVPGDRPERFLKAANSGADAIILDLEDSVTSSNKKFARTAITNYLSEPQKVPTFVRINPLGGQFAADDLHAILKVNPAGIMLPKAESAASVVQLQSLLGARAIPILPIAAETPSAVFQLGSFQNVGDALIGLTWGAEDLSAAVGTATYRNDDGTCTAPYEMVRALTLFGAHAAGISAIDTVFPDIKNLDGLRRHVRRSAQDGFVGMLAIHPAQIETINAAFTPSPDEIDWAQSIVAAFSDNPGAGALELDGRMIDKPHLDKAIKLLKRAGL